MGLPRYRRGGSVENVGLTDIVSWLPKQEIAHKSMFDYTFTLYGGARGPGKSYWLRWALVSYQLYLHQKLGLRDVTVGLFCETYPELRDRQISKISKEFPPFMGSLKETQEMGLGFHFNESHGGGFIALRNLDKPDKYQSAEFAAIAVDELTKTTKETFDVLRGSKRWPGVPHSPFLGATNPGGIGHLWVKDMFIDGDFSRYPELADRAGEFNFIRALPHDNPYLTQAYWDELNSLPPQLYKAWVEGNWDAFAGMALPAWNRNVHMIEPRTFPDWWVRWRAIDWGYAAPFCCLWFTKNPDNGRTFVYRELYESGMTDKQQALTIREMTPPGENIMITYADPSMWASKNIEDEVSSSAQTYAHYGVPLTKADNDRLSGKRKVDRYLMELPDGKPRLQITRNCVNLIRTLGALPYDDTHPEDVDTDAEDHAYDTLRYGLTQARDPSQAQDERPERKPWTKAERRRQRRSSWGSVSDVM